MTTGGIDEKRLDCSHRLGPSLSRHYATVMCDVSTDTKSKAQWAKPPSVSVFEHRERIGSLWIEFLAING